MSQKALIGRVVGDGWEGRYVHWAFPSDTLRTFSDLFDDYRRVGASVTGALAAIWTDHVEGHSRFDRWPDADAPTDREWGVVDSVTCPEDAFEFVSMFLLDADAGMIRVREKERCAAHPGDVCACGQNPRSWHRATMTPGCECVCVGSFAYRWREALTYPAELSVIGRAVGAAGIRGEDRAMAVAAELLDAAGPAAVSMWAALVADADPDRVADVIDGAAAAAVALASHG